MFLHVEEKRLEISNLLHSVTTLLRLLTTEKPALFLVLLRKQKVCRGKGATEAEAGAKCV